MKRGRFSTKKFEKRPRFRATRRHLIVERPLTGNLQEVQALADLAKKNRLFLYEAITTVYQPDFAAPAAHKHNRRFPFTKTL